MPETGDERIIRRVSTARGLIALGLVAAFALPRLAAADGAFPDSLQLLLPVDRPREMFLATNFGLLITEDDGATWRWVCEQAIATAASRYQLGAPPANALYAVAPTGLVASFDGACSWALAGGASDGGGITDAFPDPNDPMHVVATFALARDGGSFAQAVVESRDGGRSFGGPLYVAPEGTLLTGLELARSSPKTLYLTAVSYDAKTVAHPLVGRSTDGGAGFTLVDLSAVLGADSPRLAAVDPVDPKRIYLRASGESADRLAISSDGGATVRVAFALSGRMSAFLRRADGTLIVTGANGDFASSSDGGMSFAKRPGAPHVRALAERDGRLYVAADNLVDGYAVGASDDGGASFQPRLRFDQLCGPMLCEPVRTECTLPWTSLIGTLGISPARACRPDGGAAPGSPDAGATVGSGKGCGCALGGRSATPRGAATLLVLLWLARSARRSKVRSSVSRFSGVGRHRLARARNGLGCPHRPSPARRRGGLRPLSPKAARRSNQQSSVAARALTFPPSRSKLRDDGGGLAKSVNALVSSRSRSRDAIAACSRRQPH